MPKASTILDTINEIGAAVSIAIPVAGALVPVATGIIALIEKKVNSQGDVEYTMVLKMGEDELQQDIEMSDADFAVINAELEKLGKPPLTTGTGSPNISA